MNVCFVFIFCNESWSFCIKLRNEILITMNWTEIICFELFLRIQNVYANDCNCFFFYLKRVWSIFFMLIKCDSEIGRSSEWNFYFFNLRSQCKNRLLLYSFGNVILYAILQFHFEQLMCYSRSMNPTVAKCWIVRIKKSI